jgi:hypothetical protein
MVQHFCDLLLGHMKRCYGVDPNMTSNITQVHRSLLIRILRESPTCAEVDPNGVKLFQTATGAVLCNWQEA